MEFQLADRISFQHFIDSAEIPDFSTIWRFRERLNKSGVWKAVWNELQNQLDNKTLKSKEDIFRMLPLLNQIWERRGTPKRRRQ
jgi:Transposase domain (DUF772).